MIIVKTSEEVVKMRASGRMAATVRDEVAAMVAPGVTTGELSDFAGKRIKELGGESAFLGYRGYPGQICVSVNDEVVHGIPGPREIEIGDVVSIDVGVRFDGYIGDTATTVMVGVTDREVIHLVKTTEEALYAGIAEACAGARLSNVSHAIQRKAEDVGLFVVREFVGHGIGKTMHEDPQVPNFGKPGKGPRLKKGVTIAIEPMLNIGAAGVDVQADGWTVLTRSGRPSAHFEHTVAVCDGRAEILTVGQK
ncbi:MAG: type I methionyl aminopeptidase [Kiritimatiellia bacterium]|jgi:methionyl aminopeptidase|nr:type I methionyl aminopeptidase [Kiritimatiellia bacterium]MDP6631634.1 type I methionyl aminopeptidase [Kiritimatiellia bacterium]MDP6810233.1 type I methionyl aminopeptidase [Kiritimatiellia bacterium]MDP7022861.1 type I methionyl aminopeptidase [Kiritimatiellia bacterium]